MSPNFLFLIDIQPALEQAEEGTLDDVPEHITVFFSVLFYRGGVSDGHDRVGVALEAAHSPVFLFGEPDVGDEVEVGRDAETFVRPDIEQVLV